eukprot:TRINITY_DN1468_c0_g1_i1.p1 TRINITY_DN1468_c0_g1~~TRINITY_DN1468_c0_g1_i1.p1  ORF type:complete len:424 (+),score=105.35 TRINITY_DN1468_c0_g1_i1:103-1374(+)
MALPLYGMDKELHEKRNAKYDVNAENEAAEWIEAITKHKVKGKFAEALKSGVVLCELANCIKPDSVKKINNSVDGKPIMPFKERENLSNFIKACNALGVRGYDMFNVGDLYEEKNLGVVVLCLHRLGSAVQTTVPEFAGAKLGIPDHSAVKVEPAKGPTMLTDQNGAALTAVQAATKLQGYARPRAPQAPSPRGGYGGAQAPKAGEENAKASPPWAKELKSAVDAKEKPAVELPVSASTASKDDSKKDPGSPVVKKYGIDKELAEKQAAKYDHGLEDEAAEWIEAVVNQSAEAAEKVEVKGRFAEALKSGVVLCNLANAIKPGIIGKVNRAGMPFKERENLSNFIKASGELGLRSHDYFNVGDLYEEKNLGSVVSSIHSLGAVVQKTVPGFKGPRLGHADGSNVKVEAAKGLQIQNQMGIVMS